MTPRCFLLSGGLLLLPACGAFEPDPDEGSLERPFVDEWRTELNVPFRHTVDGEVEIETLRLGGRAFEGNFANRGDVVVEFANTDSITVELRRFSTTVDPELARDDFDRLSLWSFVSDGDTPLRPEDMQISKPCVGSDGGLREGCAIRVIYDGQVQPVRLGADIRVTLPQDYTGSVEVVTEDNAIDGNYTNRGNICFGGGAASLDAKLEQGVALVQTAPQQDHEQDIAVTGKAADIVVDVPATVESYVAGKNAPDPANELFCPIEVEAEGFLLDNNAPAGWYAGGAGPRPHSGVPQVRASVRANDCAYVSAVESPEAFDALEGTRPEAALRGGIRFCNGCLAGASCSDLLPH